MAKTMKFPQLYMCIQPSTQLGQLCGVYQASEFALQLNGQYLLVHLPKTVESHDILDPQNKHHTLHSTSWVPFWHEGEYLASESSKLANSRIVPTDFKFLQISAPRYVVFMFYSALRDKSAILQQK